jgi:hypothetical protein
MKLKFYSVLKKIFLILCLYLPLDVMAARSLEMDIIKCGANTSSNSCGNNTASTSTLQNGLVTITDTGDVVVFLKGAAASTIYSVFIGNWVKKGNWQPQFSGDANYCGSKAIGTITTNNVGNFAGRVTMASGNAFSLPSGTIIGQPNFAFNTPDCKTQFSTGFLVN